MARSAEWYFDFISPFSYLQLQTFNRLPDAVTVRFVPVLFAGLLNHWGNRGRAEIPRKRLEMYQYCQWYADRLWGEGGDVETKLGFTKLLSSLSANLEHTTALIYSEPIKTTLRQNTDRAIAAGVYGVPTFSMDKKLFWGFDRTDMLLDYLNKPGVLETPEMKRLLNIPQGANRVIQKND